MQESNRLAFRLFLGPFDQIALSFELLGISPLKLLPFFWVMRKPFSQTTALIGFGSLSLFFHLPMEHHPIQSPVKSLKGKTEIFLALLFNS